MGAPLNPSDSSTIGDDLPIEWACERKRNERQTPGLNFWALRSLMMRVRSLSLRSQLVAFASIARRGAICGMAGLSAAFLICPLRARQQQLIFMLGLRMAEDMLRKHAIIGPYESMRCWAVKFSLSRVDRFRHRAASAGVTAHMPWPAGKRSLREKKISHPQTNCPLPDSD